MSIAVTVTDHVRGTRKCELGPPDCTLPDGRPGYHVSGWLLRDEPMIARDLFTQCALLPVREDPFSSVVIFAPISDGPTLLRDVVSKLTLRKEDILVLKTAWAAECRAGSLIEASKKFIAAKTGWDGLLIALGLDEDLYALTEEDARRLYDTLHKRFGVKR